MNAILAILAASFAGASFAYDRPALGAIWVIAAVLNGTTYALEKSRQLG